jgi:hypothetical protein
VPRRGYLRDVVVDSTLEDVRDSDANRRGRVVRRVAVAAMAVVVVLGAVGLFGVRSATVQSGGDGYRLEVIYARLARAGMDVPWQVTVTHPGGFRGPVTLATTSSYFDMFETQGFRPAPDSETTGLRYYYQTFSPPPGNTLRVVFDAYIQPASQIGKSATTVLIIDGRAVARVSYRTWLSP